MQDRIWPCLEGRCSGSYIETGNLAESTVPYRTRLGNKTGVGLRSRCKSYCTYSSSPLQRQPRTSPGILHPLRPGRPRFLPVSTDRRGGIHERVQAEMGMSLFSLVITQVLSSHPCPDEQQHHVERRRGRDHALTAFPGLTCNGHPASPRKREAERRVYPSSGLSNLDAGRGQILETSARLRALGAIPRDVIGPLGEHGHRGAASSIRCLISLPTHKPEIGSRSRWELLSKPFLSQPLLA
jgi:hypothetical protein